MTLHKNYKIVVVGANGFVAKNLRRYLSSKNNVTLVSISRKNFGQFLNETRIISKEYKTDVIIPKIQNFDALIHLVGIGRQSVNNTFDMVNVEFTKHIVNMAKQASIKKLVYTSGLGVSKNSTMGYFISKYNAEKLIINSGLDYTIFRPSFIIGKDDLFTKHLKQQIKKDNSIKIPGSGKYMIQPININDVIKVFLLAITSLKFKNKILDLVGPDCITFEQYIKSFCTSIKKINLQDAYYNAINNPKYDFGINDLNILIGDFKGNHNRLKKITKMKFQSIIQ